MSNKNDLLKTVMNVINFEKEKTVLKTKGCYKVLPTMNYREHREQPT